ncbi:hypothetical protein ES705_47585 [subsurface metagenome]
MNITCPAFDRLAHEQVDETNYRGFIGGIFTDGIRFYDIFQKDIVILFVFIPIFDLYQVAKLLLFHVRAVINHLYRPANFPFRADCRLDLTLQLERDGIYRDNIERIRHHDNNVFIIVLVDSNETESLGDALRQHSSDVHVDLVQLAGVVEVDVFHREMFRQGGCNILVIQHFELQQHLAESTALLTLCVEHFLQLVPA